METGKPVKKRPNWRRRRNPNSHTLCWDCANATSPNCPWADHGEPVAGWKANPTVLLLSGRKTDSFHVWACPLFERDATRGGQKKYVPLDGGEDNDKSVCRGNQYRSADAVYRMAITPDSGDMGSRNRPVVDRGDREARVLKPDNSDEMRSLAYAILERAVLDWQALDYGRKREAMVERGEFVHRKEVARFFFSKWFLHLSEPLQYSPEEIREALHIPPDALDIIEQLDSAEGEVESGQ